MNPSWPARKQCHTSNPRIILHCTTRLVLHRTALQAYEYFEAPFTIADSAYGSTLFVATGFHGLHVIIGKTFLTNSFGLHFTLLPREQMSIVNEPLVTLFSFKYIVPV
jgi:heme/copper-type cytochrome/quinol oxidase subunit 3